MSIHLRQVGAALCAAVLASTGAAVEAESVLSRERQVIVQTEPGHYRYGPKCAADPIPGLTATDLPLVAREPSAGDVDAMLGRYLDRIAAQYYTQHAFPSRLVAYLEGNAVAKEVFLTALDPRYDDIPRAAAIFDELLALDEKAVSAYVHLATALAVVYDSDAAVSGSRLRSVWMVQGTQFGPVASYLDNWKYYTDRQLVRRFGFALDKLPWPILLHLADNDVGLDERAWALSRYDARAGVEKLYHLVPYDKDKLARTSTSLGDRSYSLPNLLQYGGVCVEQAHFTSRVGKCLGIPAMKVSGEGRYGGIGHCWAGYLVITGAGRPLLEFTGRYFFDYYYTGDIFDPQTRTMTLDRFVAMMCDGASLSYPAYNKSQMLVRMAEKEFASHPRESLALTQKALRLNYFNMWGWPLLMAHARNGTLPRDEGLSWFNAMMAALKAHPDMTFACLDDFVGLLPKEDLTKRQSLYAQAFRLYDKRPDLQLKLRVAQATDLVAAGKKAAAINVLVPTVVANASEGALVLPATKLAVDLAVELRVAASVRPQLKQAETKFPKSRGSTPSEAYAEFQALLDRLK